LNQSIPIAALAEPEEIEIARIGSVLAGDGASYLTATTVNGMARNYARKHWAMNSSDVKVVVTKKQAHFPKVSDSKQTSHVL